MSEILEVLKVLFDPGLLMGVVILSIIAIIFLSVFKILPFKIPRKKKDVSKETK